MSQIFICSLIIILIIIIALYLDSTKENFQSASNDENKLIQMFNDLEVAEKRCSELEEKQKIKNDMNQT